MATQHDRLKRLRENLSRFEQDHLLRFWGELEDLERENLLAEAESIDLDQVARLHRETVLNPGSPASGGSLAPLQGKAWASLPVSQRSSLRAAGMKALREGRVAAFLVAGGQGTRLGHPGPKGTLDIGLPSRKSLFQLQAERLLKLSQDCGRPVPWYIMTSRDNHNATTAFFELHDFFGLDRDHLLFFPQAELPVVDAGGKILLSEKGRISLGPNGNGGCFPALKSSGALEDMRGRGVDWVFTYGVDNALTRVCDPNFLGFALASGTPVAGKAVAKTGPEERVGVFCRRGGRPSVLEYSEMTPEMCAERDARGNLVYGAANVAMHLFRRDFLETHAEASLPYHVAHKKITFVGDTGEMVSPAAPNAYKFELFMFDLFAKAGDMAILEVERGEEFAPVKNPSTAGTDSPETARRMILSLHRRWALATGYSEAELKGLEVEVSPGTSYAGEGLTRASFRRDPDRPVLWA